VIQEVSLSTVCDIQSGGTPSRSNSTYWGGDILWSKISDIEKADGIITKTEEHITNEGLKAIRNRIFSKGTLLFAMYGSVGKTAIAGTKLTINQAILGITINNKNVLDVSYLRHWLGSQQLKFMKDARGVAQKNLSAGYIRDLKIPLPPLQEQKRIADILGKADTLRQKRQQAIDLSSELLRSSFLELCGPKAEDYNKWDFHKIGDLVNQENHIRSGPFGSALKHSEFKSQGICVLGIDNAVNNVFVSSEKRFITREKYGELKRYTVFPGDVLITIMGTTGKSAVVPESIPLAITTKHLATITPNKDLIESEVLSFAIHTHPEILKQIHRNNKGAVMPGLNLGVIRQLKFPIPPMRNQKQFMNVLRVIKNLKEKFDKNLYINLFNSCNQRAFRGEL
jgi:type I restriction enzyme, S subunit